jgi:hypothetical protein
VSTPLTFDLPADLAARIAEADYARLLGYPDHRIPAGRGRRRAAEARAWYATQGSPWAFARRIAVAALSPEEVVLADGAHFESRILASRLLEAAAPAVVVAAVSAGSEVDERAELLWRRARSEEAYFVDRFGAAVAEHLADWLAAELRAAAKLGGPTVLPAYSPGYAGWNLAQQPTVAASLLSPGADRPPGPFEVLGSGMMTPKNSLLAVFGLTERRGLADRAWTRHRCTWCGLAGCGFRSRIAGTASPA